MTYIALTIGPIYKTLQDAKKTRALWGGSYLFSYVMREIIATFKEREFIIPYIKDATIFDSGREVGLFHDRFIFESKDGDKEDLEKVVTSVLQNLADNTKLNLEFLTSYLQIYIVEKELEKGKNPVLELTPYLDTAELFYTVGQHKENLLSTMLTGNNSFLTKDAFGASKSFPSLPEIAMHDINVVNVKSLLKDDELEVYDNSELIPHLKPYHKYYAIVHADGDSMGKVVEKLKGKDDFQNFSKKLFEYCTTSHKLISDFGGETIFAGGDDLLFFAPVVSGDKTIFDLCDEISKDFDESFKDEATLSFGVSMQYYKFPLYEALKKSRNLLFDDAKTGNKNNMAFSVTKHSGQTFKAIIHKGDKELYENFKLFSSNIKGGEGLDNFLGSLHHKLDTHKIVLSRIGKDKERLKAFFDNYFNNDEHKQYEEIFTQMIDFMYEAYSNNEPKEALETVYATLRFVKFIQGAKS